MLRWSCAGGIVLVLGVCAADSPRKAAREKEEFAPITKAALSGEWKGPKGTGAVLEFRGDRATLKVYAIVGGRFSAQRTELDVKIDEKNNQVLLGPQKSGGSLGVARLTKEGKLIVTLVKLGGILPGGLEKAQFERGKPKK